MNELTYKVYVPSYKRSNAIHTNNLFEECTYVVRKSEEELYRNAGIKNILSVEDEKIDSNIKVYYYIIENAKEDIAVIVDDDIQEYVYRLDSNTSTKDKEIIISEIERIAQILYDLDLGYASTDNTSIPYGYDGEFAFKGIPGSTAWINRKKFKGKIDESVKYNFDVDIVLQELLKNRITIRPRYFMSKAKIDTNSGGDSKKIRQDQIDSINNMKLKWGKYFNYDFKHNKPTIKVNR